ncbi:MAG: pyrroline-5-carboxylate reductase [Oscillospiraceae bacterium]|nr:pyrroline-5-carboxylate reductase [Oscillospiraceae bacterium]
MYDTRLGIIGAGNMASAILNGVLEKRIFPVDDIIVSNRSESKLETWKEKGIQVTTDNLKVVLESDVIILAVKPQSMEEVIKNIGLAAEGKCVVSIAAGVSREYLRDRLGPDVFLVRAMPNMPLLAGYGATAITYPYGTPDPLFQAVVSIFDASGTTVLMHEKTMNEIIAVNGSSPAYFFRMANAMVNWAKEQGIDPESALTLTAKSMEGASKLLLSGDKTLKEWIDQVCSPGGTTLAALSAFDEMEFDGMIAEAMNRCTKRANELGQ